MISIKKGQIDWIKRSVIYNRLIEKNYPSIDDTAEITALEFKCNRRVIRDVIYLYKINFLSGNLKTLSHSEMKDEHDRYKSGAIYILQPSMRSVAGYEGLYTVDDHGNIFNIRTCKFMKWQKGTNYAMVNLHKQGNQKTFMVHRIVAEAWYVKPSPVHEVNHKDGDKWNNTVLNIEWVTKSQNKLHSLHVIGTSKPPCCKGENSGRAKLTEAQVESIRNERERGATATSIGRKYGVTSQNIGDICNGNSWRHSFRTLKIDNKKGEPELGS